MKRPPGRGGATEWTSYGQKTRPGISFDNYWKNGAANLTFWVETEIRLANSFGEHGIKLRQRAASRSRIIKVGVSRNREFWTLSGSPVRT